MIPVLLLSIFSVKLPKAFVKAMFFCQRCSALLCYSCKLDFEFAYHFTDHGLPSADDFLLSRHVFYGIGKYEASMSEVFNLIIWH